VPAATSDRILSAAIAAPLKDPQKMLAAALKKAFSFAETSFEKPLVLVGPPGAGKTLMTAKLTARIVMEGKQKPVIVTTDIARAGGVEQLSAFLDILDVPLHQAEDAKGLKALLAKAKPHTPVIVDTGGLNPFDPQEMKSLAKLLHAAETQAALVLPAGIDAEESAEIALTFGVLGVKTLIPTRLDFARRLGGILSAAERAGLSFTEASHTPQVANGILALGPDVIADLLIPRSPKKR
ncbi:MAG: GTPase, partial [Alphaproteobacteria bacterium]|nr:GTPase [Alphaproteobacteria bacterium]